MLENDNNCRRNLEKQLYLRWNFYSSAQQAHHAATPRLSYLGN